MTEHADIARRLDAARARWPADSDTAKRVLEGYAALRKLDPAVLLERGRRILAIVDGEDVKAVPKKLRKTRALPTKSSIKRRIDAAREAGLDVTAILPDGTVATGGSVDKPKIAVADEREIVL